MQNVVFITLLHSLSSRNLFTTDVVEELKTLTDTHFVFFVDTYKLDFFNSTYAFKNFSFVPVDIEKLKRNKLHKAIFNLLLICFPTRAVSHRLRERLASQDSLKNRFTVFCNYLIGKTLGRLGWFRQFIRLLDRLSFRTPSEIEKQFSALKPTTMIITDIFNEIDSIFQISAKQIGIKTISIVRSWDNTTNKGLLRQIPDHLIVNNENLKNEASYWHDVPENIIFVGGFPQFDLAFKRTPISRADFFKSLSLDPAKKLVLFSPAGQQISDTDWQICEMLKQGILSKQLPADLQILVRSHPLDPARLDKFESISNFFIECPGVKFGKREKVTELRVSDQEHLMDSLYHCDILLNITSTISLDCLPFRKPQVLVSFDGWEQKPFIQSIVHFQTDEHFAILVASGAIAVAKNKEELYSQLNKYLQDPQLDLEKREAALKYQLWNTNGDAGLKYGKELVRLIKL